MQIWHKSDDEKLEMLIDEAVKKVQDAVCWDKVDYVQMLYQDGTKPKEVVEKTFFDFVEAVYEEVGENAFFDTFIKSHYKREINIWKHKMEQQKELTNADDVFEALQRVRFEDLDLDHDFAIDFNEFQKWYAQC